MLLFVFPSNMYVQKLIIPSSRVYDIAASDCSIIINYDSGELVEVSQGKFEKKIESVKVTYDSFDEVDKVTRQFYKAVSNRAAAFFFGNSDNNDDSKKKVTKSDDAASVEVLPSESQDNLMLDMLSR